MPQTTTTVGARRQTSRALCLTLSKKSGIDSNSFGETPVFIARRSLNPHAGFRLPAPRAQERVCETATIVDKTRS